MSNHIPRRPSGNKPFGYVNSMRKALAITGIFTRDDDCNAWLAKNPDHGVVAVAGPVIFTAYLYDKGQKISPDNKQ